MQNSNDEILNILKEILRQLKQTSSPGGGKNNDAEVMTIEDVVEMIKLKKPTIYALVASKKIPFRKKGHKTLYFLRSELMDWIKNTK